MFVEPWGLENCNPTIVEQCIVKQRRYNHPSNLNSLKIKLKSAGKTITFSGKFGWRSRDLTCKLVHWFFKSIDPSLQQFVET